MARNYSPDRRSRPPDPLRRSTRPARISPSGRVSFWGVLHGARSSPTSNRNPSPTRAAPALGLRRRIMMSSDSLMCLGRSDPVSGLSLLVRVPDQTIPRRHEGCDPAPPCRHECLRMHSTRSPRNGAPSPSGAARIFLSSMPAAAGSTTTTKSNSSIACVRPFASRRGGPKSRRRRMKSHWRKIKTLPRVRAGPRLEAALRVISARIRRRTS